MRTLDADPIVYLGVDDALDVVALGWATMIGAARPLEERISAVLDGDANKLASEVGRERSRRRLMRLRSIPGAGVRCVEMLADRIVLLVDDKSILDEEDLLPATVIAFGRGDPTVRRVGSRVFLSPGSPSRKGEGLLLLDDGQSVADGVASGIAVSLHDVDGAVTQREFIEVSRSAKLRVHGAV